MITDARVTVHRTSPTSRWVFLSADLHDNPQSFPVMQQKYAAEHLITRTVNSPPSETHTLPKDVYIYIREPLEPVSLWFFSTCTGIFGSCWTEPARKQVTVTVMASFYPLTSSAAGLWLEAANQR